MIRILHDAEGRSGGATPTTEGGGLSDYYRALFQQLRAKAAISTTSPRAIGVTSCAPGEGVSTVSANLALSAARDIDAPVLLVDANFWQPHLHEWFRLQKTDGLCEVLQGNAKASDCLHIASHNLSVLTAGRLTESQRADVATAAIASLLAELKRHFHLILFDLPAATQAGTCLTFAGALDGVVLVVEAERVRNQVIARVKEQLLQSEADVLGVVLNKRRDHVPGWIYRRL